MGESTAIMPSRYIVEHLKDIDPKFYAAKEIVILQSRKEKTFVPPENAMIVPTQMRGIIVTIGSGRGNQIRPLESANPQGYISGSV